MAIKMPALMTAARAAAGLSQRQLAAKARTAQSLVARIEGGHANPTLDTIERLLDAAGFELDISIVPKRPTDAVVDFFKRDIDRSLLRGNLDKTPQQRFQALEAMAALYDEMQRARATHSKRK